MIEINGALGDHPGMRAIGCALPNNYYSSQTLSAALWQIWDGSDHERSRYERIHRAAGVRGRHLALPIEEYALLGSFAASNEAWTRVAADLGMSAVEAALDKAGLQPDQVDHIFFNTVTGIASPSIDVKLINRLGMRPDIKRTPMFGLGCVGGASGTARAADYLRAYPNEVAILLSVELCSLTLQIHDRSIANVIATALFGDGAAAVVLGGGARKDASGPRILGSRSLFFPDTEELMGWRIENTGFRVVLTGGIPDLIRNNLREAVDAFLAEHHIDRSRIKHWMAHTGGPKVLRAMEAAALELPPEALARSWKSLAEVGNLSSASVLFVAADFLDSNVGECGDYGVLLSMGPGFCGELVLFQW